MKYYAIFIISILLLVPLTSFQDFSQTQKLTASGLAGDEFGVAVASFGDTVIVGARGVDVGSNSNQGSAYVFTKSGGTWTQTTILTASDGAAGDGFGRSVAIRGSTIIIGSENAAYLFTPSGNTWTQTAKLTFNKFNIWLAKIIRKHVDTDSKTYGI